MDAEVLSDGRQKRLSALHAHGKLQLHRQRAKFDCTGRFLSGYIVFHHSPYAIGPVLACYTAAPAAPMPPSYLPPSMSDVHKRLQFESSGGELDEKSRLRIA